MCMYIPFYYRSANYQSTIQKVMAASRAESTVKIYEGHLLHGRSGV
jgi:hypothetical protein